ncbi:MAG: DCC1-like thiol-disulfide oxidoreductase family protein [Bacteroidetes bacterium]|jgi:predicted DCC family thiol-disulfide oxidoreductase YuxK|nr:DCC1-like thiol-disulfide oxidoreductase family protein [Bacteroidota bacterium]
MHTPPLPGSKPDPEVPIVLFDGVCTLCNRSVRYILRHDRRGRIRVGSLQAHTQLLQAAGSAGPDMSSILLLYRGRVYRQSSAVLRIGRIMGGWHRPVAWLGYLLPRLLRDSLYRWVASHRYRWFGQEASCPLPDADTRSRFL